jgi:hypothetical protein
MKKVRPEASWNELSARQQQILEGWLFDERLSYDEALKRAKGELKYKGTRSSLRRFYEHTAREREASGFEEARRLAEAVNGAGVTTGILRRAGMKVMGRHFLKQVTQSPDKAKEWGPLAKLLLRNEENEWRRKLQGEENVIRRAYLDLARERFHYQAMEEAMKALPQLKELEESMKDPEVTKFEANKKMNDLRRQMFGDAIPELKPENAEEEAHPEIIEQRYREARRRQNEQWAKEHAELAKEHAEERRRAVERGILPPEKPPESRTTGDEEPEEENIGEGEATAVWTEPAVPPWEDSAEEGSPGEGIHPAGRVVMERGKPRVTPLG